MIKIILLLILTSCAHKTAPSSSPPDGTVTVDTAIDQARSSYLLGCVEAFKELKIPATFEHCRDKALLHQESLNFIMGQNL